MEILIACGDFFYENRALDNPRDYQRRFGCAPDNTPLPNGIYVDILIRPVDMTPELKSELDQWDKASDEAWTLIDQEAVSHKQPVPKFGSGKGLVKMSDDFDEPLEDFDGSPSS